MNLRSVPTVGVLPPTDYFPARTVDAPYVMLALVAMDGSVKGVMKHDLMQGRSNSL